jgi:hypothetical protein
MFASWQLRLTRAPDLYGVFWRAIWCHLGTPRWRGSREVPTGEGVARSDGPDRRGKLAVLSLVVSAVICLPWGDLARFGKSLRSDEVRSQRRSTGFPTPMRRVYLDTVEVWRSSRHGPTTPTSNLRRIDPKARAICVPIRRSMSPSPAAAMDGPVIRCFRIVKAGYPPITAFGSICTLQSAYCYDQAARLADAIADAGSSRRESGLSPTF